MPDFDKLKTHCDKLSGLLSDPHPGQFTWCKYVSDHCIAITKIWGLTKNITQIQLDNIHRELHAKLETLIREVIGITPVEELKSKKPIQDVLYDETPNT